VLHFTHFVSFCTYSSGHLSKHFPSVSNLPSSQVKQFSNESHFSQKLLQHSQLLPSLLYVPSSHSVTHLPLDKTKGFLHSTQAADVQAEQFSKPQE